MHPDQQRDHVAQEERGTTWDKATNLSPKSKIRGPDFSGGEWGQTVSSGRE